MQISGARTLLRHIDNFGGTSGAGGGFSCWGVGCSAANCSHAVNDFRKLCAVEAYSPVNNVSELTARTNDEGWETVFAAWLRTSEADVADKVYSRDLFGGNS